MIVMLMVQTAITTTAQFNDSEEEWEDNEMFDITEVPEKWSEETAVVLYQKMQYSYTREKGKKYTRKEVVRRRIKLQDKAAITEFSEFYYVSEPYISYYSYAPRMKAGFKIIKPDGREEIVDLDGESVEYGEVPSFFKPTYVQIFSYQYKKAAIPNLEIGDIIDFYYLTEKTTKLKKEYDYAPFIFSLEDEYPIVNQTFEFVVGKGHFLNFKTYQGAGELKETTEQAYDKKGNPVESENRTYEITDSDREKEKASFFNYSLRSAPTVKFQAYYIPKKYVGSTTEFVGDVNVPRSNNPTVEEIRTSVYRQLKDQNLDDDTYVLPITRYILYNNGRSSDSVKAVAAFNYFRFKFMLNLITIYSNVEISTEVFIETMAEVFKKTDVDYDILVGVPRNIGTFDELLLSYELTMMLRVKGESGEYFYLSPFDYYKDYTDWEMSLAGADVLILDENLNVKDGGDLLKIGADDYLDNREISHKSVKIDDAFKVMDVRNEVRTTGRLKRVHARSRLYLTDFLVDDIKYYNPDFRMGPPKTQTEERKEWEEEQKEEKEKQEKERREDFQERWEDDDFDVEEYTSFEILNLSRIDGDLSFSYAEELKLNSLIKKAGKNYIVEIGRLIGDQLTLEDEDKGERDVDAYINYPKQYGDSIVLEIPAGYEVANIEDFNVSIDNDAGSFVATGRIDGNHVIIETYKTYKSIFVAKDNWNLLEEMLVETEDFMGKKLLLKKES